MARGKKTGGKDFEKGNKKPKKSGRKRETPEIKALKEKLKSPEYRNMMADCWDADIETLDLISDDRSLPSGLVLIAKVLKNTIDYAKFDQMVWFYDRMFNTNTASTLQESYSSGDILKTISELAMQARLDKIEEDIKRNKMLDDAVEE